MKEYTEEQAIYWDKGWRCGLAAGIISVSIVWFTLYAIFC